MQPMYMTFCTNLMCQGRSAAVSTCPLYIIIEKIKHSLIGFSFAVTIHNVKIAGLGMQSHIFVPYLNTPHRIHTLSIQTEKTNSL